MKLAFEAPPMPLASSWAINSSSRPVFLTSVRVNTFFSLTAVGGESYMKGGGHATGFARPDDVTRPATLLTRGLSALSITSLSFGPGWGGVSGREPPYTGPAFTASVPNSHLVRPARGMVEHESGLGQIPFAVALFDHSLSL